MHEWEILSETKINISEIPGLTLQLQDHAKIIFDSSVGTYAYRVCVAPNSMKFRRISIHSFMRYSRNISLLPKMIYLKL
jgi:hypothetical protein